MCIAIGGEEMKKNVFDFDVVARGSFIDNATSGDPFLIEAITIRLNHIAFNTWLAPGAYGCPEDYKELAEWEQSKAEKDLARAVWEKTVIDSLGLRREEGKESVTIIQAMSEVFTMVYTERLI
jgi:hypothetical protein